MRKAYTEDEKTEIAQLYRDGRPVNEIASKFGRKPDSIYKLLSSMGVKRRKYEKPEVIAGSDASEQPRAKRECTLKKPWYLQRQTPNNKDKAKHE
jgi:transposase-like protein